MKRKATLQMVAAALAATLIVTPTLAQDATGGANGGNGAGANGQASMMQGDATQAAQLMNSAFDRLFMLKAAQGNSAEIMESQLALRKARSANVRQTAQQLIQDHNLANVELTRLLGAKGQTAPRTVGATHMAVYNQLSKLGGAKFDMAFMAGQVEGHEDMVTLFQQEIAQGQDPDVKAYATRFLPAILNHTMMIYTVARAVGAPGIEDRPAALISGAGGPGMMGSMAGGTGGNGTGGAGGGGR